MWKGLIVNKQSEAEKQTNKKNKKHGKYFSAQDMNFTSILAGDQFNHECCVSITANG